MKILLKSYLIATLIVIGLLIGSFVVFAAPAINILGNRAVVGTGLNATTSANGHLTASGTVVFTTLGSGGNPCLTIGTTGIISTSTCGGGTFTTTTIQGIIATTFSFASGTSGDNFNISSGTNPITFNFPSSSATNRGLLISADWTTFNNKQGAITLSTSTTGTDFTITSSSNTWTFNLPNASGTTHRGLVSTGVQTLGGAKTFLNTITVSGSNTSTIVGDSTFSTLGGDVRIILGDLGVDAQGGQGVAFRTTDQLINRLFLKNEIATSTLTIEMPSASAHLDFGPTNDAALDNTFTFPNVDGRFILGTSTIGSLAKWTALNTLQSATAGTDFVSALSAGNNITLASSSGNVTVNSNLTFSTSGAANIFITSSSGTWTLQQTTSSASNNGFLSSADWTTFNNKVGTSRAINTAGALLGGGDLSADRTLYFGGTFATSGSGGVLNIASSSGNLWTFNLATSTASQNGYLLSADWTNFASKATSSITISAGLGLTGGGDLTANRTLTLNMLGGTCTGTDKISSLSATGTVVCTADSEGAGTFTTTTFTVSGGTILSQTAYTFATSGAPGLFVDGTGSTITFRTPTSSATVTGFLQSADWTTFNNKQNNITFPIPVASTSLTGGAGLTLTTDDMACDTASASIFGCLTSANWTTFNGKQNNISFPIPVASTSLAVQTPIALNLNTLSFAGTFAQTTGQVHIASTSGNTWTFSLPQTIWATSSVQFRGVTSTFLSSLITGTSTNFNATGTLRIPNAAAPTLNAIGMLALDTTDNQLQLVTSSVGVVYARTPKLLFGVTVASSAAAFASSNLPVFTDKNGTTAFFIMCHTDKGTTTLALTDHVSAAGNATVQKQCGVTSTSTQQAVTTNNTWTAGEQRAIRFASSSGSPNYVIIGAWGIITPE